MVKISKTKHITRKGVVKRNPRKSKYNIDGMPNLPMNDRVYLLRRKVIELIYEANRLVGGLPRITVRITTKAAKHPTWMGCGVTCDKQVSIYIPAETLNEDPQTIKYVVFHEIIHTVFNFKGHKTAGLMRPIIQRGLTDFQINEMFIKEVNSIRRKN